MLKVSKLKKKRNQKKNDGYKLNKIITNISETLVFVCDKNISSQENLIPKKGTGSESCAH